jgi:hypothetical protein
MIDQSFLKTGGMAEPNLPALIPCADRHGTGIDYRDSDNAPTKAARPPSPFYPRKKTASSAGRLSKGNPGFGLALQHVVAVAAAVDVFKAHFDS